MSVRTFFAFRQIKATSVIHMCARTEQLKQSPKASEMEIQMKVTGKCTRPKRPPQRTIQTKIKCSQLRGSHCGGRPDNLSVCGRVKCQLLSCHQKKIMRINVFPQSCLVSFLLGGRTYTSSGALFALACGCRFGCGACAAGWPKSDDLH